MPIVLAGGASAKIGSALTITVRLSPFGSAPLIEDNAQLSADLLNLFDAEAADITYFYTSRMTGEAKQHVEDQHIHPVEPRQIRLTVRYRL